MDKNILAPTYDKMIRSALREKLENYCELDAPIKIIDELGVLHGEARIDLAVIYQGTIHGFEVKSDVDSLSRLPEQMKIYNSVFSKITLVVGKKHIFEAIKIIPEWWGISMAKIANADKTVLLYEIRKADLNPAQDSVSVARLLWKDEAISMLEDIDEASGVRSKTRALIYKKIAEVFDRTTLNTKVNEYLCAREDWRVGI